MPKLDIPSLESKSELFAYLKENKEKLIAEKKSAVKYSDVVCYEPPKVATKAEEGEDTGSVYVKVVANSTNVLDSHMDVLLPGCYDKTIKERSGFIPHLHDHKHEISARVGDVQKIYTQQVSFSDLGLKGTGTTECLVFETNVLKDLNENIYNQYKTGRINQHSIGLLYDQIELAINDEESEKEKDFWDKYINQIINPEKAIERGYFWVIPLITLIENSAVLFGSNHATPTLSSKQLREEKEEEIKKGLQDTEAQLLRTKRFNKLKLS